MLRMIKCASVGTVDNLQPRLIRENVLSIGIAFFRALWDSRFIRLGEEILRISVEAGRFTACCCAHGNRLATRCMIYSAGFASVL